MKTICLAPSALSRPRNAFRKYTSDRATSARARRDTRTGRNIHTIDYSISIHTDTRTHPVRKSPYLRRSPPLSLLSLSLSLYAGVSITICRASRRFPGVISKTVRSLARGRSASFRRRRRRRHGACQPCCPIDSLAHESDTPRGISVDEANRARERACRFRHLGFSRLRPASGRDRKRHATITQYSYSYSTTRPPEIC